MSAHTSDDLIKSVRVRGMFPDASRGSLSAENILLIASEEIRERIAPLILSVREHYYETYIDYDVVANQSIYQIPYRAIGGLASTVQYISNQSVVPLSNLDPYSQESTNSSGTPRGFWFENEHITVYPKPNSASGQVRVRYYQRPSLLAQTIDCSQIIEVDSANSTVKVRLYPSSWSSGLLVDFISNNAPYTPYAVDYSLSSIAVPDISSETLLTFAALPMDKDGNLAVKIGDWVALAGYTPMPEIMPEFFPSLAQATALRLMLATGDYEGAKGAKDELKEMLATAIRLITPREQFGLKKVVSDWRNF